MLTPKTPSVLNHPTAKSQYTNSYIDWRKIVANSNEAQARIKINRLLEEAGWRFEDSKAGKANIQLEAGVKYTDLGDDFKTPKSGAIDFLLLDKDQKPLAVVEAKKESINPLIAKKQARDYAHSKGARFVILSNGNTHYLWDTECGNPKRIFHFPTQESLSQYWEYEPDPKELTQIEIDDNYVMETQSANYATDPDYLDMTKRPEFIRKHDLAKLRQYQVQAIRALQQSVNDGNRRFLFEMATGTGKTLISATAIKLFLKSGNVRRVLFLVDRLELRSQAQSAFEKYLGKDYRSVIYEKNNDSWVGASIVVSTIQTFLSGNRYRKDFSPDDFELVISDEAHRSIGGNSRAVFEYFIGYKLGLTATPKNYLHGFDTDDPRSQREYERRLLRDTYKTFGCEPGKPTFSYDLKQGADEGYLIKPTVADARTDITTKLLSDGGYVVYNASTGGETIYKRQHYERIVFNRETNVAMCKALLNKGLYDPVAEELGVKLFGKTLVFAVSQDHAARLTQILNELAWERWPDAYGRSNFRRGQSNFAMQVTSQVATAQQMSVNFANNRLEGQVSSPVGYESSRTRVCVTVDMMTTGYDCEDLLNVALMRPIFSPINFVQIKGRGTRKWTFEYDDYENEPITIGKDKFKLIDFFANCEYFEKEFDYDEKIPLPVGSNDKTSEFELNYDSVEKISGDTGEKERLDLKSPDRLASFLETKDGKIMRVDRARFDRALKEDMGDNLELRKLWESGDTQGAEEFTEKYVFNNPKHYINLDHIRLFFGDSFYITVQEVLAIAFGEKNTFDTKIDRLDLEWKKFAKIHRVDEAHYSPIRNFFEAYIVDKEVRDIVKTREFGRFDQCESFGLPDYEKLNGYETIIPQYIQNSSPHLLMGI